MGNLLPGINNKLQYIKILNILNNDYLLKNNSLEDIKKLLLTFDTNICNENGKNLLHTYAYRNNYELLKLFLDNGCNINKQDNLGKTPIFYATSDTLLFFITNGADLLIKNNNNQTILNYISKYNQNSKSLQILLAAQTDNIYNQFEDYELLNKAVLFQDIPKIKELLDKNIYMIDSYRISPLEIACNNGFYNEFLCLLEYDAKINDNLILNMIKHNYSNITNDHIIIIKKLIELNININSTTEEERNLLHICINEELIDLFIKSGIDIHHKTKTIFYNGYNNTPFCSFIYTKFIISNAEPLQYLTTFCDDINIYKKLFKHGADPHIQNNFGINAFMAACSSKYISFIDSNKAYEIIKLFIDNNPNIYLTDKFGNNIFDLIYNNNFFSYELKTRIIKLLHDKFKLVIFKPDTNNFIYKICL